MSLNRFYLIGEIVSIAPCGDGHYAIIEFEIRTTGAEMRLGAHRVHAAGLLAEWLIKNAAVLDSIAIEGVISSTSGTTSRTSLVLSRVLWLRRPSGEPTPEPPT